MFSRRGRGGLRRSQPLFANPFQQSIYDKLREFAESNETELKLDPMTREERKLTHDLVLKLGLRSVGRGEEPNRYMTIMRPRSKDHLFAITKAREAIELHPEQQQAISIYLRKFPVEQKHVDEHLRLSKNMQDRTPNNNRLFRTERLVPPRPKIAAEMKRLREELPAYELRTAILRTIREKQVTIITGGTGCGKTTQVPQFILEEAAENAIPIRITCTQPRRLPAIAIAARVAKERSESLGSTVGYHIRLEQKTSPQTVLTYCTTGVLLRTLAGDGLAGDVSHIILDEVHERQQNTDYLLIAVRQILEQRSDLKVILMSATMDGNRETFTSYFAKFDVGHAHIPSRLHNVETFHLSQVLAMTRYMPKDEEGRMHGDALQQLDLELDQVFPNRPNTFDPQFGLRVKMVQLPEGRLIQAYDVSCSHDESIDVDLTLAMIKYCLDSAVCGSILVFLPGYEDILTIQERLAGAEDARTQALVCALHSQMDPEDQQRVFDSAPSGHRKVILSTNIAEASLTIQDVVFVIDCGMAKELTYDHNNRISELNVAQIAKSNAEQRRGRAGRCRNGFCFRLYSSKDFEDMPLAQVAEMKRVAIHDICLHAKIFAPRNMTAKAFLELAPEPPSPEAIEKSLELLEELGALSSDSAPQPTGPLVGPQGEPAPTKLGRLIARLPLDPQQARMLIFGLALRCVSPVLTLVSTLSHRDPFILPLEKDKPNARAVRENFARRDFSDHLTLIRVFNAYEKVEVSAQRDFCRKKFLSHSAMRMIQGIRQQLVLEISRLGLFPSHGSTSEDADLNTYSNCWPMVQAAVVAGCYPSIAFMTYRKNLLEISGRQGGNARFHPSSAIMQQLAKSATRFDNENEGYGTGEPKLEYLLYEGLWKISGGLTLRTVTVTPPLTVILFAGSMRMRNDIIEDFELAEEDFACVPSASGHNDGEGDFDPLGSFRRNAVELEPWLAFRGATENLQLAMKLRFKTMSYLLSVLANLGREPTVEDEVLLSCLRDVLVMDHKHHGFNECTDLAERKYNSTRPNSSYAQRQHSFDAPRNTEVAHAKHREVDRRLEAFDARDSGSSTRPRFIDSHCHIDLMHAQGITFNTWKHLLTADARYEFGGCISNFCYPMVYLHSTWDQEKGPQGLTAAEKSGGELNQKLANMDLEGLRDEAVLLPHDVPIWATFGTHPKHADEYTDEVHKWLHETFSAASADGYTAIGVGECGLDESKVPVPSRADQMHAFRKQLELAKEFGLPVVVHLRASKKKPDALEDVALDLMEKELDRKHPVHRHCFRLSMEVAQKWTERFPNAYFGLTPCVIKHTDANDPLRRFAQEFPLDRIVLETDSPFFGRGKNDGCPADCMRVAKHLASLRNISLDEVLRRTEENTRRLYKLDRKLRNAGVRMLTVETLQRILRQLSRDDLDAVELANHHLRSIVQTETFIKWGPLRQLDELEILPCGTVKIGGGALESKFPMAGAWVKDSFVLLVDVRGATESTLRWFIPALPRMRIAKFNLSVPSLTEGFQAQFFAALKCREVEMSLRDSLIAIPSRVFGSLLFRERFSFDNEAPPDVVVAQRLPTLWSGYETLLVMTDAHIGDGGVKELVSALREKAVNATKPVPPFHVWIHKAKKFDVHELAQLRHLNRVTGQHFVVDNDVRVNNVLVLIKCITVFQPLK